jgi:hypothetical protein
LRSRLNIVLVRRFLLVYFELQYFQDFVNIDPACDVWGDLPVY